MNQQTNSDPKEVTAILSRFIAETEYEQLPYPVTERIKKSILDTIGIIMPASELMPDLKNAIDLYIEAGGKEESSVLAYGVKLPSWAAAFTNGIRGHALDYADGHLEAVFRIGISVIPPALALAERKGVVSGKELITAIGVAEEFLCRLGVSVARRRHSLGPWHEGILLGNFGATAAAARMLNLSAEQTERAFGIAFLQAGGTLSVIAPDANIRGMYAGFVAKTGVLAALMAQRGVLGPRGSLSSAYGLFELYFKGAYDRDALIDKLGREFELINLSFKPWPACAFTHPYIDAMLGVIAENSIRAEEIESIEVFSGKKNRDLCQSINIAKGQVPKTVNDAKRSVAFNVAVAALRENVTLQDFTVESLSDSRLLQMAEKVRWVEAQEFDEEQFSNKGNQLAPGKVAVTDRQGRTFTKRTDFPYGHHLNPVKAEDLVNKFRDCLALSPRPVSGKDRELVIDKILNLEEVADIREIIKPLS
ncbi:MAG: MmgE/PrpD family protein [Desulfobacteraceae bacterium]|nr:MmgE/PrpD family protein [Desulfobacteraceae bacterium]